mgnify:CR=1 FL=1
MKKVYFKKTLSLFMAVMMLLSCWVFVAPTEAEAAVEVSYQITLDWDFNVDNRAGHIAVSYYKFSDDGKGIDVNSKVVDESLFNSFNDYGKGYQSKTFTIKGFPYEIYYKNGSSGTAGGTLQVKVIKIGTTIIAVPIKAKSAPIEILFHGYKGSGERDLSTGVKRAFKCKRNALIVDQRASGKSAGHTITFGINERHDCLSWTNFVVKHFGDDVKIILTGISMGAATVLLASSMDLPKNVVGILADCGYDKASNMIKKVIKEMKLPANFFYPLVKLGAKIFGHFNLEETSPYESVQNSKVPIIFIHGDNDSFVPYYMSDNLYNVCSSKKKLVKISNADHGVSYLVDPDTYIDELNNFFTL